MYQKQRRCLAAKLIFGFILVYANNRFSSDMAYSLGATSVLWALCVNHN